MQIRQQTKIITLAKLAPFFVLAACGGGNLQGSGPVASLTEGPVQALSPNLEASICNGRAQEAIDSLSAEPLVSATDRFYTALALEETGAVNRARLMYARVMQTGSTDSVRASCFDRVLANGPVVDEAGRRLAALSQYLTAMDVNLAPPTRLHDGIAPSGPIRVVDPVRFSGRNTSSHANSMSTGALSKPTSQSPLGRWFVHLASYRSIDAATKNRSTLEAKFPQLAGIIDQWELDVDGSTAVRLGVRVSERTDANTLCNSVKSQQEYCAVIDTSQ